MNEPSTKPPGIQRAIALRNLNRVLDLLECSLSLMDSAKLLYPGMDPKCYNKIYKMAHTITVSCPINTNDLEF